MSRSSREPRDSSRSREDLLSLRTRSLLSSEIISSLLPRSALSEEEETEVFLSLIGLSKREELLDVIRLLGFSSVGRITRELDSLVLTLLLIRDDLSELIRLLELSSFGRVNSELDSLVLTLLPIFGDILELIRLLEPPV